MASSQAGGRETAYPPLAPAHSGAGEGLECPRVAGPQALPGLGDLPRRDLFTAAHDGFRREPVLPGFRDWMGPMHCLGETPVPRSVAGRGARAGVAGCGTTGSEALKYGKGSTADAGHLTCEEQAGNGGLLALIHDADQGTIGIQARFNAEGQRQFHLRCEAPAEPNDIYVFVDMLGAMPYLAFGVDLRCTDSVDAARAQYFSNDAARSVGDAVTGEDCGVFSTLECLSRHTGSRFEVRQPGCG